MARTFLFGGTLLDGIHEPQSDVTVIVEGNRIAALGRRAELMQPQAQDQTYDVSGMTLMPGLFQCHLHAAMDNIYGYHDLDMKYPANYLTLVAAKNVELMLNVGFTSAVGAGSPANIDVVLKHAIAADLIKGPRLFACSQHLVTTGESLDYMPSFWRSGMESGFGRVCDGPDEFRKAVRAAIKDGADIVKVHATGGHGTTLSTDCLPITVEELRAACDAAHERGKKIRAHAASRVGILMCAHAGVDLIDHVDFLDDECIEAFLKHGTSITPGAFIVVRTLNVLKAHARAAEGGAEPIRSLPSPFFSSISIDTGEYQRALDNFRALLPRALQAGVNIINGDDFAAPVAPHGTYADELVSYVDDIGIAAKDVIRWATGNAARFVGEADLGVLDAGKIADLLIVKGDPLANIALLQQRSKLAAVMKDGKFVHSQIETLK
jgi:imidazolonepropionase-like amidohydrolase